MKRFCYCGACALCYLGKQFIAKCEIDNLRGQIREMEEAYANFGSIDLPDEIEDAQKKIANYQTQLVDDIPAMKAALKNSQIQLSQTTNEHWISSIKGSIEDLSAKLESLRQ